MDAGQDMRFLPQFYDFCNRARAGRKGHEFLNHLQSLENSNEEFRNRLKQLFNVEALKKENVRTKAMHILEMLANQQINDEIAAIRRIRDNQAAAQQLFNLINRDDVAEALFAKFKEAAARMRQQVQTKGLLNSLGESAAGSLGNQRRQGEVNPMEALFIGGSDIMAYLIFGLMGQAHLLEEDVQPGQAKKPFLTMPG